MVLARGKGALVWRVLAAQAKFTLYGHYLSSYWSPTSTASSTEMDLSLNGWLEEIVKQTENSIGIHFKYTQRYKHWERSHITICQRRKQQRDQCLMIVMPIVHWQSHSLWLFPFSADNLQGKQACAKHSDSIDLSALFSSWAIANYPFPQWAIAPKRICQLAWQGTGSCTEFQ